MVRLLDIVVSSSRYSHRRDLLANQDCRADAHCIKPTLARRLFSLCGKPSWDFADGRMIFFATAVENLSRKCAFQKRSTV